MNANLSKKLRLISSYDIPPVFDLPGADFGEFGGENVGRPLVAEHDGFAGFGAVFLHGVGEFAAHRLAGPPDAVYAEGFAEIADQFFAAVVRNDNYFDASFFAFFDPGR